MSQQHAQVSRASYGTSRAATSLRLGISLGAAVLLSFPGSLNFRRLRQIFVPPGRDPWKPESSILRDLK